MKRSAFVWRVRGPRPNRATVYRPRVGHHCPTLSPVTYQAGQRSVRYRPFHHVRRSPSLRQSPVPSPPSDLGTLKRSKDSRLWPRRASSTLSEVQHMRRPWSLAIAAACTAILIAAVGASARSGGSTLFARLAGTSQSHSHEASGARTESPEPSESPESSAKPKPSEKPERPEPSPSVKAHESDEENGSDESDGQHAAQSSPAPMGSGGDSGGGHSGD